MLGDDNMYKVRALINFDDVKVQDENGKNVKRIANQSEWEVNKDRYLFLKEHNAVELVEVIPIKKETNKSKTTKKKKSDSNG